MNPKNKILVLDDQWEILDCLGRIGRKEGFEVLKTSTLETAQDILAQPGTIQSLAMAFIDVDMHGRSGLKVYRKLRTSRSALPIIIMSGGIDYKPLIPLVVDDAGVSFLSKPFSAEQIQLLIRDPYCRAGDVSELLEQASSLRDPL